MIENDNSGVVTAGDPAVEAEILVKDDPSVIEEAVDSIEETPSEPEEDSLLDVIDKELGLDSDEKESTEPEVEAKEEESTEGDEDDELGFPKPEELKGMDDKAVAKWGELRGELKTARDNEASLTAELDAARKQAPVSELEEQLKVSQEELTSLRESAAVFDVEKSPEYMAQVAEPIGAIMEAAEALAERNEISPDDLFDALSMEGKAQDTKIEDLVDDMSDRDRARVYRMMDDAGALFRKSDALKANATALAVELEGAEQVRVDNAQKADTLKIRAGVETVFDKFKKVSPDLGEGVNLDDLKTKTLQEDFGKLTHTHKAYAMASGAVVPKMISALKTRDAEIARLNSELAGFAEAKPKVPGAGPVPGTAPIKDAGKSLMDVISDELGL